MKIYECSKCGYRMIVGSTTGTVLRSTCADCGGALQRTDTVKLDIKLGMQDYPELSGVTTMRREDRVVVPELHL